ncbi:uncharacterized protein LOC131180719 [Hevea brasiliensis]|uniref:uncharacterized protein LOC131180719 n=1 Tax=Hevea brasiliensis TaxID=3981 RepID=UPI0025EC4FE1|nr:uncharacterized protein LOC131180719 [Hevea brasiliensis]
MSEKGKRVVRCDSYSQKEDRSWRTTTGAHRYKTFLTIHADQRQKDVEFAMGDYVFLKVSPMKGVMRVGKKGKLAPCYIEPFQITDRVGAVAYQLKLPPNLSHVHPLFHISMLWKYVLDPSHVLQPNTVKLNENLIFEE